MSQSLDFRPRSVAELVDAAVQLYKRDALTYILIAAVAFAPSSILQIIAFSGMDASTPGAAIPTTMFVSMIVGLVGYTLMSAVLVHLSSAAYLGEPADAASSLRAVAPRLVTLLVNGVLKWTGILFGMMLFLVPGLYLFARWFATTPSIVLEGRGVGEAFSRSGALSKSRKRHIFNTLALVYLLFYAIIIAVSFMMGMFGFIGNAIIPQVIASVASVVVYPVIGITEMLLYYDARIRGEAFDVELLARGLTTPASDEPQPQH